MHILSIIRIIGILIMCFSGTMLIPAFVALIYGDGGGKAFMQAFVLSFTVGTLFWWPCHHHKQELRSRRFFNCSGVLVCLRWASNLAIVVI